MHPVVGDHRSDAIPEPGHFHNLLSDNVTLSGAPLFGASA